MLYLSFRRLSLAAANYYLERKFAMELIDDVTIYDLSKIDLLLIIKWVEFTGKKTKNKDFIELRNSIVKELCFLTETSEDQFLTYLDENC